MPMTSMVDRLIRVAEFCPYVLGRPFNAIKKDSTGQSLCDVESESLFKIQKIQVEILARNTN